MKTPLLKLSHESTDFEVELKVGEDGRKTVFLVTSDQTDPWDIQVFSLRTPEEIDRVMDALRRAKGMM